MSAPFKVGDRVRYKTERPDEAGNLYSYTSKWAARTAIVIQTHPGRHYVRILWDDTGETALPNSHNLELIPMIDTTKPLVVLNSLDETFEVTFVTETSDGNILVSAASGSRLAPGWFIFNRNGDWVRAENGNGQKLKLKNKGPIEQIVYQVIYSDGRPSPQPTRRHVHPGTAEAALKLIYRDGILVDVGIAQPNSIPTMLTGVRNT